MVTTITVLFSGRQPGKPEGERVASRPAARRGGGVEGSQAERPFQESWWNLSPERGEGPPKSSSYITSPTSPSRCSPPPGSPPCKAGIMAKGKDYTAPSDNNFTAYRACPGPSGPSSRPLLCPMSDYVSSLLAQETQ